MRIKRENFWPIMSLGLIVLSGFVLRIYQLGVPPMWVDESISALASKQILSHGFPVFDSGLAYTRALLFHYLQAFFLLFSQTDFTIRLVSVLFGTGTILLAYFIGKEFNKPAGYIAALVTAVLFIEILYSRQARFYQLFQFLFFLSIFFLYKSKSNKNYAWAGIASLILLVQTQIAGVVLIPFFLFLFWKEHKDKKLIIFTALIGIYYLLPFLSVQLSSAVSSTYAEQYSSGLFGYLRAFALISLAGIPFAFKKNKRLALLLVIPAAIMIFGLFFVKVSAIRYAYVSILVVPIFTGVLLSEVYNRQKILAIMVIAIVLIYPSNLFFQNSLTIIKPEAIHTNSVSEPVIDYKSIPQELQERIKAESLVVFWAPGAEWYLKKPDYVIPFSLNGLPTGFALYNGKDSYTGALVFDGQVSNFILIEDRFSLPKLGPSQIEHYESIKQNCSIIYNNPSLKIYDC